MSREPNGGAQGRAAKRSPAPLGARYRLTVLSSVNLIHNGQVAISEGGTCICGLRIWSQQPTTLTHIRSNPQVRPNSSTNTQGSNTQGSPHHRPAIMPSQNSGTHVLNAYPTPEGLYHETSVV